MLYAAHIKLIARARCGDIEKPSIFFIFELLGALACQVFGALCSGGLEPHTVASSVNSISAVVDTHVRDEAVACLRETFTWPE